MPDSTAPGPATSWTVVVPVKRLDGAKSRLSTRAAAVRRDLSLAFALDTVAAALAAGPAVHVVTDDERVAEAVRSLGAAVVTDSSGGGLNDALRLAEDVLRAGGAGDLAALAGDLPALRPGELAAALAEAGEHARAFVPDAVGTGTTLLCARAGTPLDPRFGARSCAAHASSGAARLSAPGAAGLRRDVDTEVDLWDAVRLGVGPATAALTGP
ncbi:MAG TPA: 2-phospho-L-lactate guanylyltransferase [Candidatus Nanopelagicales bacterium]|nr:2-phospho-L-lactate guanylyltransferase [Candidatus Nanopelagicales bacterium]